MDCCFCCFQETRGHVQRIRKIKPTKNGRFVKTNLRTEMEGCYLIILSFSNNLQRHWLLYYCTIVTASKISIPTIQYVGQNRKLSQIHRIRYFTKVLSAFETSAALLFFQKVLFPKFQLQQYFSVALRHLFFMAPNT